MDTLLLIKASADHNAAWGRLIASLLFPAWIAYSVFKSRTSEGDDQ